MKGGALGSLVGHPTLGQQQGACNCGGGTPQTPQQAPQTTRQMPLPSSTDDGWNRGPMYQMSDVGGWGRAINTNPNVYTTRQNPQAIQIGDAIGGVFGSQPAPQARPMPTGGMFTNLGGMFRNMGLFG